MKLPRITLCCFSLTMVLALGSVVSMIGAVDMFLKIEGIDGESKDDAHKDEIDILSWSWGMSNSGSTHGGGGGGAGMVSFQDFEMTKALDKASPKLLEACANGGHIPEATLSVRKAGGGGGAPLEYLTIKMTNILVSFVSTGASAGEDRVTENVTFNFSKVDVKYVEQDPTGAPGGTVEMSWNLETNTP